METTKLDNGLVKLTSENGIIDKRTNQIHTEVICKESMIRYFVAK